MYVAPHKTSTSCNPISPDHSWASTARLCPLTSRRPTCIKAAASAATRNISHLTYNYRPAHAAREGSQH
eukprot:1255141-Prymnesium_polylepis.1